MVMDYFSLKKPFEESTGKIYEDAIFFEKVWKRTKSYKAGGYVDPHGMAPFAIGLLQESKVTNPADALFLFYNFVNSTTKKCMRPRKKGNYGPIELSPEDYYDFYSMRTLIKGRGICNQIAAEILGLSKSVGIPSFFKRKGSHGYVKTWVPEPGWVHLGYSEGILCDPKNELFGKFIRKTIELMLEKNDDKYLDVKISERISEISKNMEKYGFCDRETVQVEIKHIMSTITSNCQITLNHQLFEVVELVDVNLSHPST